METEFKQFRKWRKSSRGEVKVELTSLPSEKRNDTYIYINIYINA